MQGSFRVPAVKLLSIGEGHVGLQGSFRVPAVKLLSIGEGHVGLQGSFRVPAVKLLSIGEGHVGLQGSFRVPAVKLVICGQTQTCVAERHGLLSNSVCQRTFLLFRGVAFKYLVSLKVYILMHVTSHLPALVEECICVDFDE